MWAIILIENNLILHCHYYFTVIIFKQDHLLENKRENITRKSELSLNLLCNSEERKGAKSGQTEYVLVLVNQYLSNQIILCSSSPMN